MVTLYSFSCPSVHEDTMPAKLVTPLPLIIMAAASALIFHPRVQFYCIPKLEQDGLSELV